MKKDVLSLFTQYLLLFITVAFVPSIIIFVSLQLTYSSLEDELNKSNQASIQLIQQALDSKLEDMNNLVTAIEGNPDLTRYSLKNSPLNAISTINTLASQHEFLDDIFIVSNDYMDSNIYTASGVVHPGDLKFQKFAATLNNAGLSCEEYLELVSSAEGKTYWPTNSLSNSAPYLYLICPIYASFSPENSTPNRTATLLIRQDYIRELFQSSQTTNEENFLLLNEDMEPLIHITTHVSQESLLELCDYLKHQPEIANNIAISLDGEDYFIYVTYSKESGLYYVRFLEKGIAFHNLYRLRVFTIIAVILMFFACLILIFLGMKRSYVPIRNLSDWIKEQTNAQFETKNEIVFLKHVFKDTFSKNATLSTTLDDSKQGLIDYMLTSLIQGNFAEEEAFHNACNNLELRLDKAYYCVASLIVEECTKPDISSDFEAIKDIAKNVVPDDVFLLMKNMLFADRLVFLFNGDSDESAYYRSAVENIQKQLFEQQGLLTSIGIGCLCNSYDQVGKSYLESTNALDYRLIYGKNCLITPDMCSLHPAEFRYPNDELKNFHTALKAQNEALTIECIENLKTYTKSKGCSLHTAKYICFDTFAILKRMPIFSDLGYMNHLTQTLNITRLTSFETVDDFFDEILNIVNNMILCSNTPEDNNNLEAQLSDYIMNNCFRYDFQISSMAEHFHISQQYMRRIFKKYTGLTISDYIANLKLEKAMQLLRDTDLSPNDIVAEIGNTDVSGFFKFFKTKTGLTPGQYRNMNH